MNVRNLSGLLLSLLTLVVLGCGSGGGGGGGSPTPVITTLTGEASKGPIIGGDVKIYAINAVGTLQTAPLPTTNGNPVTTKAPFGNYSAVISYEGPVKVVVTGGSYTDEATGTSVDFTGKSLSAVVANVTGPTKVSVTPFTEMAAQKAGSTLTTTNIKVANTAVAIAMGLQGVDIVAATPSTTPAYKSELAVFSQALKNKATDVASLITQTVSAIDISTGTFTDPAVSAIFTTAATNAFSNQLINVPGQPPLVDGSRVSTVTLSASQNPVPTNKTEGVTISAVVTIVAGGIPADGTVVTFTASAGTVSAVTTTTNGVATANLKGITTTQTVSVTAAVGAVKSPEININFTDPLSTFIITVKDTPGAHFVNNPVAISVNAVNSLTPPVPISNTAITFAVTSGTGTLSSTSTTTDANGNASASLTSAVEGTVVVTITVGQATGSHTTTFTDPNKPASIALVANRNPGLTNNVGPVILNATLLPANIAVGAIADGTPVTFTIVSGTGGTLSSPTANTIGGVASVTLNSTAAGSIVVNATVLPVTSNPVSVSFINQPTKVTVVVRTTGTLPGGTTIGGFKATVTASPSSGLTIAADPNGASSDVSLTGAGAGSTLITNSSLPPVGGAPAAVTLALINTSGIQTGEFATLIYHIAVGSFPTASNFSITLNGSVIDTLSTKISGIDVAIQSVTIQ